MIFGTVIFTDESRVTLDGPDGWSKGWIFRDREPPSRLRRQQGGGGIMIWAGIVNDQVIGPYKLLMIVSSLTVQITVNFLIKLSSNGTSPRTANLRKLHPDARQCTLSRVKVYY